MEDENKKISKQQKEILVSFMEDHIDFARGRLQTAEGRMTFKNLWLILAEQLNHTGKQKTVHQWQRTWTDIKIKVKRKVSAMKTSRMKTGGGPMTDKTISDFDDRVIKIISEEAVFGIDDPDNVCLESEQPATESVLVVAGPSGLQQGVKRNASTCITPAWVEDLESEENAKIRRTDSGSSTQSPVSESHSQDEGDTAATPRRQSRMSAAATAAKDLQQLSQETNQNIQELANEVAQLNKKIDVVIEQNNEQMVHRMQTNTLLERIARALEGQTL